MVVMTSMLAVVQTGYGSPERVLRVQEVERPSAGDGEVLIRVRATSVNTPDWLMVTGVPYVLRAQFGLRGPKSPIRGTDVAGVVEAVGTGVSDAAVPAPGRTELVMATAPPPPVISVPS